MNQDIKRLAAILLACVLLMSLPVARMEGQTQQVDLTLKINPRAFSVAKHFDPSMADPLVELPIVVWLSAINRLNTTLLIKGQALSGVIGTDKGEVLDFQAELDMESGIKALTTSVLPRLRLSLSPEIFAQIMSDRTLQSSPEAYLAVAQKLLTLTDKHLGQVFTDAKVIKEAYTGYFGGDYDSFASATFKNHHLAAFMEDLATELEGDVLARDTFVALLALINPETRGQGTDVVHNLRQGAAQFKAEEETSLAWLDKYTNADGLALYDIRLAAQDPMRPFKMEVLLGKTTLKAEEIAFLGGIRTIFPSAPTKNSLLLMKSDWDKMEEDILAGRDVQGVALTLLGEVNKDEEALNYDLNAQIGTNGLLAKLEIKGQFDEPKGTGQLTAQVHLMMEEPLLTLTAAISPSQSAPVPVKSDNAQVFVLKERNTQEEIRALYISYQAGYELLLDKIAIALE